MSPSFEWSFDEDADERKNAASKAPTRVEKKRWLRSATIAIACLVAVGVIARAWVTHRLKAIENTEAELRAAVDVELDAIASGDEELYRALQDPNDSDWRQRQLARYIVRGGLGFTPAPGLEETDRPAEIRNVQAAGRDGRVELVRWFRVVQDEAAAFHGGERLVSNFTLLPFRVTWFYGQASDGRWYHIAPPTEFASIPHSWHGNRLVIQATEVEAELLDAVARYLATLATQGAALSCPDPECSDADKYNLSFEDAVEPSVSGSRWVLPAPYLAGLPDNEDARSAWTTLLAHWVVEALAQTLANDARLTDRIVFEQLVAHMKAHFGLVESPGPDIELVASALREGKLHRFEDLWAAERDPGDPKESELLVAEIGSILQLIEDHRGPQQVLQLLPALQRHTRFSEALAELYRLDGAEFQALWSAHLADLTGLTVALPATALSSTFPQQQPPPPVPAAPMTPVGNQVALMCDGRIWAGNVDGSQLVPLTGPDDRFSYLEWSPDGRWLITTWQPHVPGSPSVLYLLAADGDEGRSLTDEPAAHIYPLGWSADGREAIFAIWRNADTYTMEIRAVDVETGDARPLPGVPTWSPDGSHLNYVTGTFGSAWLVEADWKSEREIAQRAWATWQADNWSPDGSRLALLWDESDRSESVLAVYDLAAGRQSNIITSGDLTEEFLTFDGDFVSDGSDLDSLNNRPLRWLWPFGWSADGRHILVWAHRSDRTAAGPTPSGLVVISVDGSPAQLLAFGATGFLGTVAWSPTNADLLVFSWPTLVASDDQLITYLYNVKKGPIYQSAQSQRASWSPDGQWLAFENREQIVIVNEDGDEQYSWKPEQGRSCSDVAWNPASSLIRLGR